MRTNWIARLVSVSLLLTAGGCSSKPAATPAAPDSANSSSSNPSDSSNASNSAPATAPAPPPTPILPPPPPPLVIPAGTMITITLDQALNSATANNGDGFAGSLATPITSGNLVALPVGTRVGGTVVAAQSAGKFKGNALMQLVVNSVRLNGTRYPMQTNEIEDVGKSRGKRTAVGAGGGAAFGAILGAVAGGGKGAAIGALAGGGAGTAGAAFTGKKDIVLAAETRLHFRLAQPLTIPAPGSADALPPTAPTN